MVRNEEKRGQAVKRLVFCASGNVIEFYDFTLYAYFATNISQHFFPSSSALVSLLSALGAFSVSYLARPLGALYFGRVGDYQGRKRALCRSIGFMGIPTLLIAGLPTYNSIGVLAPIFLVIFRIAQGFCMGGEFGGASVYLIESTRTKYQGFVCGLLNSSIVGGMLLSSFACCLCDYVGWEHGWRVAFLLGALMSFSCYHVRSQLGTYASHLHSAHDASTKVLFPNNMKGFLCGVLVSGFAGLMFYTSFVFPKVTWALQQNLSHHVVSLLIVLGLLTYAIMSPLLGLIVPRFGMRRMMLTGAAGTLFISPFFPILLNSSSLVYSAVAVVCLAIVSALFQVCVNLYLVHCFPTDVRCRGVSLSYTVGVGLLGGTSIPLFTLAQSQNQPHLISIYVMLLSMMSMGTIMATLGKNSALSFGFKGYA